MTTIQLESISRGITRLCHFSQSRNLAHVFGDQYGICATKTLQDSDMPHNPTDPDRYDGRDYLVCCSIEYPNPYYFLKARDREKLFKDWVVIFIEPDFLWNDETEFCPCNAASLGGAYIGKGKKSFQGLFSVNPANGRFQRRFTHLQSVPTDIQAEALISDPIPLDSITGIAVQSKEQAQREICRLNLQGITIDKPIYIAPDFFKPRTLSGLIQSGSRATETLYNNGGLHDR